MASRQISTQVSSWFAPGLTPPLYTYPPATSVVLASISFLLVFFLPNTLGTQNAGEEDVDQFAFELSVPPIAVSTFIYPSQRFCLWKNLN